MPKPTPISYKGREYPSIAALHRALRPADISVMTLQKLLARGLSVDEALRWRPMSPGEAGRKAKAVHRKNKNPMWT